MEKKKNIIIGILIAIIFLLIGLIFAILIMTKGKENSNEDNKSTSTSTQTLKTSKVSETTTIKSMAIEEYEKKLNEKLSSVKSPLEKKYNLQRKIILSDCVNGYCEVEIKYLYNNKEIISSYIEDAEIGDTSFLTNKDEYKDEYNIKEISDTINNDKYYALYFVGEGDMKILSIFDNDFELLKEEDFCPSGIVFKNGKDIYGNSQFKFDSKTINYVTTNSDYTKVLYHKLIIENGTIKDTISKEDSADNYIFSGCKN